MPVLGQIEAKISGQHRCLPRLRLLLPRICGQQQPQLVSPFHLLLEFLCGAPGALRLLELRASPVALQLTPHSPRKLLRNRNRQLIDGPKESLDIFPQVHLRLTVAGRKGIDQSGPVEVWNLHLSQFSDHLA